MNLFKRRYPRRHPQEGDWRAYLDGALPAQARIQAQRHLESCPVCRQRLAALESRTARLAERLDALPPQPVKSYDETAALNAAARRLERYIATQAQSPYKEKQTMSPFFKRYRMAWLAAGLIVILVAALTLPPVQALANSFLGLFRVQQVQVIEFDPANLPANFSGESIAQLISDEVKYETTGEAQEVSSVEEAAAQAGFTVRLPGALADTPQLTVQPGMSLEMTVDLARIRLILEEMGRGDIQLPDALDGADIRAVLPASVTAVFGACKAEMDHAPAKGEDPDEPGTWSYQECTALVQLPSPTLSAPEGLDVTQIGQAFLQLTGMQAEDAATFSQSVDWATTLVVPVPSGADYETVTVDGVSGVLLLEYPDNANGPYILFWVKDGIVYALNGYGDSAEALVVANSLK